MSYKILNLYACLGGNRYKWDEVSNDIEVTAVELDPELAKLYQERFPNDTVIVADAHQYLLDHYQDFDFIWTSPPCPTHSRMRKTNTGEGERKSKATYPDMKLYQEIILLQHFFKGKYCVENVIPFYEPLIPAKKRDRHLYWTNFKLPHNINRNQKENFIKDSSLGSISKFHEYDFRKLLQFKKFTQTSHKGGTRVDKIARNLVDYEAGKSILSVAMNIHLAKKDNQIDLFP